MGSGIITVMKSKVWVLGSLDKTGALVYLLPKRKHDVGIFHLLFFFNSGEAVDFLQFNH